MGFIVSSVLVAALAVSCSGGSADLDRLRAEAEGSRAVAEELRGDLGRARTRIASLERSAAARPSPPGGVVALGGGGPTMRGPLLALPRLGLFRWACGPNYFRIVFEPGPATVRVEYDTPGPGQDRTVHPGASVGASIHSGQTVTWRVTHRHPPGFVRALVTVTPLRTDRGECLLSRVEVEQSARLYD